MKRTLARWLRQLATRIDPAPACAVCEFRHQLGVYAPTTTTVTNGQTFTIRPRVH